MSRYSVLFLLLAAFLVACTSNDSQTTPASDDNDQTAEATETSEPTSEESPTSASTEEETPTPTTQPAPTPTEQQETDDQASGEEVEALIVEPEGDINTWTYEPEEITVSAEDTITWTNDGDAAHTVTSVEGSAFEFDSGSVGSGENFSLELPEAGEYKYFCTFHPWMEGTIVVE